MTACARARRRVPALAALLCGVLGTAAAAVPARSDSVAHAQAEIDSLDAYWRQLDSGWYEPLTPDLLESGLDDAAVDSLSRVGDRELGALLAGRRWRVSLHPLAGSAFNRCEGWRPAASARLRRLGRRNNELVVGAGYGLARRRAVWEAALTWPLLEAAPETRPDRPPRRPWTRLAFEAGGGDDVAPFGTAGGLYQALQGVFTGDDPFMYYARQSGRAALVWRPAPRLEARLGALAERHRPLAVATRWNVSGDRDRVGPNWPADHLVTRASNASLAWSDGRIELRGEAQWHHVTHAPFLARGGGTTIHHNFLRLNGTAAATLLERHGHELAARLAWERNDRAAPLQWKSWLGGARTLRGYPVRELAGDSGLLASLDARSGFDLLRALRVPWLGAMRLQPIVFVDYGRTAAAGGPPPPDGVAGWRADAGFGFGRLIGVGGRGNLRVYLAKPILNGQAARPWQVQLEIEL